MNSRSWPKRFAIYATLAFFILRSMSAIWKRNGRPSLPVLLPYSGDGVMSTVPDREKTYPYIIWHANGACDHERDNVCTFCDYDGYLRENYARPQGPLPARGDRLYKKGIQNE